MKTIIRAKVSLPCHLEIESEQGFENNEEIRNALIAKWIETVDSKSLSDFIFDIKGCEISNVTFKKFDKINGTYYKTS